MKGDIKCIKAAFNECILRTNCINKNVKQGVIKYWKVQYLIKCTVGGVTSKQKFIGYLYCFTVFCFRFLVGCNSAYWESFKILYVPMLYNYMCNVIINTTIALNT